MKARELRIGNWYASNGIESQVESDIYMNWHVNGCWADPILLNEEWLLKFGFIHPFKDLANVRRYLINDGRVELRYLRHNNTVFLSYFNAREIKYVHQLQNLYFALIGEELTIKETGCAIHWNEIP